MVNNPRTPIIGGAVVGFILCGWLGSLIDHQPFYGLVSVLLGAVGAGLGMFIGYKISQSIQ